MAKTEEELIRTANRVFEMRDLARRILGERYEEIIGFTKRELLRKSEQTGGNVIKALILFVDETPDLKLSYEQKRIFGTAALCDLLEKGK